MCFHMLNLCRSITKIFLSVLVVFGKYFVFAKIVKNSKIVLPCSGDSVAGRTNRESVTEIFRDSLATHWGVNVSIAKKT